MYSKVERLFIKERNKQVVEGLNKWMASSGKQLICLKKDKISLRNQLYEIKNSYGELISMEPHSIHIVEVAWTHSVWVTFDILKDLRLQEGPQCGVVALVVAAGVMRDEGITVDKVHAWVYQQLILSQCL